MPFQSDDCSIFGQQQASHITFNKEIKSAVEITAQHITTKDNKTLELGGRVQVSLSNTEYKLSFTTDRLVIAAKDFGHIGNPLMSKQPICLNIKTLRAILVSAEARNGNLIPNGSNDWALLNTKGELLLSKSATQSRQEQAKSLWDKLWEKANYKIN